MPPATDDELRRRLCALGDAIRDEVVAHRDEQGLAGLAEVVGRVEADVIYAIDRVSEHRVRRWFADHWPTTEPVRLVMEGIDDHEVVTYPEDIDPADVAWVCVIDPIDGTRNLMFDKRSAWVLTALAPAGRDAVAGRARFGDLTIAAMTEIPTTKQWRADQLSAVKGGGPARLVAEGLDVRAGGRTSLRVRPSRSPSFEHGFCSFAHYLPDAKALLADIEQHLWDALVPPSAEPRQIFEDQFLCSAGQIHEVLTGRDRLVGDLRPLALAHLGAPIALSGHPYDICTALLLTEAGGVFEDPWGRPVDVPLDTTTPVTWVAYANEALAAQVRPALARALQDVLGLTPPAVSGAAS